MLAMLAVRGLAQDYYIIKSLEFTGNETFSDRVLKKQISTKANRWYSSILFWKEKSRFNEREANLDVNKILNFYQSEGYLSAKVLLSLTSDHRKEQTAIEFRISEGRPIRIREINWDILTKDDADRDRIQEVIKGSRSPVTLRTGDVFRDKSLLQTIRKLREVLYNEGYPYTEPDYSLQVDQEKSAVSVAISLDPGPACQFGDIKFTGNNRVKAKYLLERVGFDVGDRFNQKQLTDTQRRIQQIGMFRYVTVNPQLTEGRNFQVPVTIDVKEAPRFDFRLGVGYGYEDRFRASLNFRKLGFLGGIRRLTGFLKHSYLEPYHLNFRMIQPGFITLRTDLTLNPFLRREQEASYTINRLGSNILLQQQFGSYSSAYLNYALEQDKLDMEAGIPLSELIVLENEIYRISSISLGWVRDNSTPVLAPTKGIFTAVIYTYSGLGFLCDYYYQQALLEVRHYREILTDLVLAGKIKIGGMEPLRGQNNTPLAQRFFAGGSNSVRGWSRSQLGPKDEEGIPLGGNSLLEGSLEIRFPIWKIIRGVCFVDFGNVWSKSYEYSFSDWEYSPGTGLRIQTPIGPGRLDLAFPVSEAGQSWQFHLSIGEAF